MHVAAPRGHAALVIGQRPTTEVHELELQGEACRCAHCQPPHGVGRDAFRPRVAADDQERGGRATGRSKSVMVRLLRTPGSVGQTSGCHCTSPQCIQ